MSFIFVFAVSMSEDITHIYILYHIKITSFLPFYNSSTVDALEELGEDVHGCSWVLGTLEVDGTVEVSTNIKDIAVKIDADTLATLHTSE